MTKLVRNALVSILMISTLTGCSNSIVLIAKESLCEGEGGWKEITLRKADTLDTKKQVVGSNEARKVWCK